MADRVDVEGLAEFNVKMDNVDGSKLKDVANRIGALMLATSKTKCPVDTGNLRGSINLAVTDDGHQVEITIGTNVEYAPYVEYGTGARGSGSCGTEYPVNEGVDFSEAWVGMFAQPFLRPALYDNDKRIIEMVTEAATKEAKGE